MFDELEEPVQKEVLVVVLALGLVGFCGQGGVLSGFFGVLLKKSVLVQSVGLLVGSLVLLLGLWLFGSLSMLLFGLWLLRVLLGLAVLSAGSLLGLLLRTSSSLGSFLGLPGLTFCG